VNDIFELLVGVTLCSIPPVVILGGLGLLVRYLGRGRNHEQITLLEGEVAQLRAENATVLSRLSRLEATVARMDPAEAVAARDAAGTAARDAAGTDFGTSETRPHPETPPAAGTTPPAAGTDFGTLETRPHPETPPAAGAEGVAPGPEAVAGMAARAADASASSTSASASASAPQGASAAETRRSPDAGAPGQPPAEAGSRSIQWEQWIGVRGAAALGASILVLAGIYFFEYSIEHGLITPAMRMVAGTLVGLGCVLASELRLRRTHEVLANWLAGAGVGILYVAFWAGHALYQLYPTWAAFGLLVAVTGACVTLAVKRDASAIAVLGLLGGFATPLALSTGSDRPIPLFGYLLLLDGAMLWVAHRRRWAWMALICLLATAAYQYAWLLVRLDEPRLVLGVLVVAVFAVLFAALPRSAERDAEGREALVWKLTRSAGVILPLLITVPLALRQDLGDTYWATAAQLVLLSAAAAWVGLRHRSAVLPTGAALVAAGALLGWAVAHPPETSLAVWKLVGLALALAAVHHAFAEVARRRDAGRTAAIPAVVTNLAFLTVAALAAPTVAAAGPWPWLLLWAGLVASTARLASAGADLPKLQLASAALAALGLGVTFATQVGREGQPSAGLFLGLAVAAAVAMQLGGLLPRPEALRRHGDHAGALFALLLAPVLALAHDAYALPGWALIGGTLLLAVLALLAAARRASSGWMIGALLATALAHGVWVARRAAGPFHGLELVGLGVAVLLFALFPVLSPRALRERAGAWRTAAFAGPVYLLPLRHVWLDVLGPSAVGVLPLALAAVSIGAAWASRARGPEAVGARRAALVWLTASAAGFVTLAIPLQLDKEWITIGWALEALALTVLWRRLDHAGLKYLAFALAAAVCVRLLANPYVLGYYPRAELRLLNWLTYTYLVPAAALVGMWAALRTVEVERRRPFERSVFPARHAVLANVAAAGAIGVVFVWLNLTIFDWFATGPELTIPLERLPARDLTLSIAWALYALCLLGLGMWRRSTALRAVSLALILVTSGKVFLYDLAHLSDLYRVASLAGLAISLIVISLAYQRFVFRKPQEARS
jgi:uncharacterized membrane protein